MSHEHLGLFDTPPSREEVRAGIVIVGLLLTAFLLILPFGNIRSGEVQPFVPTIDSVVIASDLIIATVLYSQGELFGSRALIALASGYVLVALLLIPHALTFPGAFAPDGLLGAGVNTTAWLAMFRRLAFPLAVILYAVLKRSSLNARAQEERPTARILPWLLAAIALAASATMLAIGADDLLPSLFLDRQHTNYPNLLLMNSTTIALTLAAIGMLFRQPKSVLDMWLLVALAAWLIQSLLNLPLRARFTIGWYGLFSMMLASSLVVMLALLAESNRLYAKLALAKAARNRERDARLMTMDAVAAAIAHEIGQPLTGIALNASVAQSWLNRSRPNIDRAIEALRSIHDSGQRTFDIIKNIRAIVAKGPDWAIEFSLNDLVRETVGLLDRELSGAKVSLQLSLDESLPPVLANRVQMQQVLVNLVTNSIESLALTRNRRRRITIRSVQDDDKIMLEVSDSGVGIAEGEVWRVFDAFHTTKATGTGIGLSLCRTIVEEHGGRIWASQGAANGAIFHVQLPRSRMAQSAGASQH